MPNLPKQWIAVEADDKEKFAYQANCSVTVDGIFSIQVDERIAETCRMLLNKEEDKWKGVGLNYSREAYRLHAKSLKDGIDFLKYATEDFMRGVETTERVIVYGTLTNVSFWRAKDGSVHANGIKPDGGSRSGEWWTPKFHPTQKLHATERAEYFSIGLTATVFDKITTTRKAGIAARYTCEAIKSLNEQHPAYMLNSFCGLDTDTTNQTMREMPYTDEAALFFYDFLLGLCKMAEKIDEFCSDKKLLMKAIESRGSMFLLTNPK